MFFPNSDGTLFKKWLPHILSKNRWQCFNSTHLPGRIVFPHVLAHGKISANPQQDLRHPGVHRGDGVALVALGEHEDGGAPGALEHRTEQARVGPGSWLTSCTELFGSWKAE